MGPTPPRGVAAAVASKPKANRDLKVDVLMSTRANKQEKSGQLEKTTD